MDDQMALSSDSQGAPLSEIRDADLDTVAFKIQRPSPNQKKLLLLDSNGVAAVALECFQVERALAIYEATNPLSSVAKHTNEPAPLLARFDTNFRPSERRLIVDLPDRNGASTRIQCRGRWEDKEAWPPAKLSSEEKEKRKAQGIKSKPYKVTIAPGVDTAFVVLVCAALDWEVSKKDEIFHPTPEDTARLAERPLHDTLRRFEETDITALIGVRSKREVATA